MTINNEVKKEWKMLSEHGDISDIIAANPGKGFTRYKVRSAMNSGQGDLDLMKAISKHFKNRKKEQQLVK